MTVGEAGNSVHAREIKKLAGESRDGEKKDTVHTKIISR